MAQAMPVAGPEGIVIGPSHVVRWRHAHRHGILPGLFTTTHFVGEGGLPVWHRGSLDAVLQRHRPGLPIFFILPDFRFGNSIRAQAAVSCGRFYAGHSLIRHELITPGNDALMYRHHVENLMTWRAMFGTDLRLFDWTSLATAVVHLEEQRYLEQGQYANPHYLQWRDVDCARTGAVPHQMQNLQPQLPRLRRLFTDRSLHPSPLGFLLLHHIAAGNSFANGLKRAEDDVSDWIATLADLVEGAIGKAAPVRVTGTSVWMDWVGRVLSQDHLDRLAAAGLRLEPGGKPGAGDVIVTDEIGVTSGLKRASAVIRWGAFARTVTADRHKANRHLAVEGLEPQAEIERFQRGEGDWLSRMFALRREEALVDAGGDLAPTYMGFGTALLAIALEMRLLASAAA
ncbi:hypothetical protein ATO6_22750 [Oceanicola sp. 22II-s10i]|nr:hypothetical protein ATO6_22750 [Oceanicola sp. 22II-s10i]